MSLTEADNTLLLAWIFAADFAEVLIPHLTSLKLQLPA